MIHDFEEAYTNCNKFSGVISNKLFAETKESLSVELKWDHTAPTFAPLLYLLFSGQKICPTCQCSCSWIDLMRIKALTMTDWSGPLWRDIQIPKSRGSESETVGQWDTFHRQGQIAECTSFTKKHLINLSPVNFSIYVAFLGSVSVGTKLP